MTDERLREFDDPRTFIVLAKGHSATRLLGTILRDAGVFTGGAAHQNPSSDMVPPTSMYRLAREYAKQVVYHGGVHWSFPEPQITPAMVELLVDYLRPLAGHPGKIGWKLPETLLAYPVVSRLLPRASYICWTRHPLDSAAQELGGKHHGTHWLGERFGVPGATRCDGALSYLYQFCILARQPRPSRFLWVRFEDVALDEHGARGELARFLGEDRLPAIRVKPERVYVHGRQSPISPDYLVAAAHALGYA